jgi:hypothetical protein
MTAIHPSVSVLSHAILRPRSAFVTTDASELCARDIDTEIAIARSRNAPLVLVRAIPADYRLDMYDIVSSERSAERRAVYVNLKTMICIFLCFGTAIRLSG